MGAITVIVVVVTSTKSGGVVEWGDGAVGCIKMVLDANERAQDSPPFVVRVLVCDMEVEVGVRSCL